MSLGERIKQRREELGLSQADLSRALGLKNNSTVNGLEKGITKNSKHTTPIAKILKVRPEWLERGEEPMASNITNVAPAPDLHKQVPLLGKVAAGAFVHTRELEPHEVETWLMSPKDYKGRAFGLKVEGDSMTSPTGKSYPDGAIAVFDSGNKTPENGELVLAKVNGADEVTFKKYVTDAGNHYLMPLNPSYPRIDNEFRVLAVFEYAIIY